MDALMLIVRVGRAVADTAEEYARGERNYYVWSPVLDHPGSSYAKEWPVGDVTAIETARRWLLDNGFVEAEGGMQAAYRDAPVQETSK